MVLILTIQTCWYKPYGLDLSGGDSVVNESSFRDIGDKAISVGEEALA